VTGGSKKSFWYFAIFSLLGLFIVEDFVAAPVAFPVFALLFAYRGRATGVLKPVIISSILVLVIYFSLRTAFISRPGITEEYYYLGYHMIRVFFDYLGWFVIPSPGHPYFQTLAAGLEPSIFYIWRGMYYLAMIGLVPFSAWMYIKSPKQVRFFILFIYIALVPILPLIYKVGPRNIYLPSLGIAVIAGYVFYFLIWSESVILWIRRASLVVMLACIGISVTAIIVTSLEYRRTQALVADMIEDLRESGVDFNQYKFTLLDNVPGRAIIGPPMMYKLDYKGYIVASNDPVRGPIDIEMAADSLYKDGVPIIVFDYRNGRMVEATEEYISSENSKEQIP
jgi:hypothetical protein